MFSASTRRLSLEISNKCRWALVVPFRSLHGSSRSLYTLHVGTHKLAATAKRRSSLFDTVQPTYIHANSSIPYHLEILHTTPPLPPRAKWDPIFDSNSLPPPNPPPYIQRTRHSMQSQRVQRRVTHFFFLRQWRKRLVEIRRRRTPGEGFQGSWAAREKCGFRLGLRGYAGLSIVVGHGV